MQKFWRGVRVKIADKLHDSMSHFPSGMEAIVEGSYSDLCHGHNGYGDKQYSLVLLREGKPYNTSAWYDESQLTLINPDRDAGERIIQQWRHQP